MRFFAVLVALAFTCISAAPAMAQTCDANCTNAIECRDKIAKCQEAWNQMETAKKPHVDALRKMEADIAAFQSRIKTIEADVAKKAAAIAKGEQELSGFLGVATRRIREFYIRNIRNNVLSSFFSSTNIGFALRVLAYQKAATNEDKKIITHTALSVKDLEEKKQSLEKERASLSYLKEETDKRAASVRKLVGEANAYQSKLSSFIASLTAIQQQFLAQKLSGLNLPTSLGAGPLYCTDDRKLDPGFSPAFAFFTYGIPHRVGMNQYGALGRAQAGQSAEDILRAYFDNFELKKDYDTNITITVDGYGGFNIEDYVKRIYEMPESWPLAALKAQAVAARSYALAYTGNGSKSICATQSCQVFKPDPKGGAWNQAVEETRGWVMVSGGSPITAWYSSTDGGYTFSSADVGWNSRPWTKRTRDTSGDVGSFGDLQSRAFDRDSPCFYAAQGWRNEYAKSAWLKPDEVADIANVILLARRDSSVREHLYQTDKPNPSGTDTWDKERVKQELRTRGGNPFNTVSSVSVSGVDWTSGITTQVTVSGDAGSQTFDGSEFKSFFNLRAPANIQIVGPLFNIERR